MGDAFVGGTPALPGAVPGRSESW